MFIAPYCSWYPIAPVDCSVTRHFVLNRLLYTSNLLQRAGCLWYNNMRHDRVSLDHIDRYNDFVCDDYFLTMDGIKKRFMEMKNLDVAFVEPNVFDVERDGMKMCIMATPIDDIKTRVFIFFNHAKNSDSVLMKKLLRYNIRMMIQG